MSLLNLMLTELGFGDEITPAAFRYTVLGRSRAVVEGVIKIVSLGDNEIIFAVKGGELRICGAKLAIKKLGDGEAAVEGDITEVSL